MSSSKFIEVIQPVVNGNNVGFVSANVKKANQAAGLTERFGVSVDAPTNSEWVNPVMFIAILTDAIKKQQELNVAQEAALASLHARIATLESQVNRNAQYIDGFDALFKEVTIAEPVAESQESNVQEPLISKPIESQEIAE